VQEKFVATFGSSVSPTRLQAYRLATDRDDLDALGRYLWNTALSEALYPSVQNVEIALRNSLHQAIGRAVGDPFWLTAVPSLLTPAHQAKVSGAIRYVRKRKKEPDVGRVVAELTFGFWVSLFNKEYETRLWRRPGLITATFPAIPRDERGRHGRKVRNRHALSVRLNRILELRNRVFHHEPIWNWPRPTLIDQHAEVREMLGWINPLFRDTVVLIDRFPTVYGQGSAFYRRQLEGFVRTLRLP